MNLVIALYNKLTNIQKKKINDNHDPHHHDPLNDDTKILTETDTETFFSDTKFSETKTETFFRNKIFQNRNCYFFS